MLMEGGRKALYHKKHPMCVCVCVWFLAAPQNTQDLSSSTRDCYLFPLCIEALSP